MKPLDDEKIWKIAQKRVAFRRHFFVYCIVNIFLILLWYFTSYRNVDNASFWFIYPLFGWGIGLAFNYWAAYYDDETSVEREYKKIKANNHNPNQQSTTTNEVNDGLKT